MGCIKPYIKKKLIIIKAIKNGYPCIVGFRVMQGVQIRAGCVVGVQIWAWWNLDFEIQLDLAGEEGQSPHITIYPRDLNQGILHISCKFCDPSLKRW